MIRRERKKIGTGITARDVEATSVDWPEKVSAEGFNELCREEREIRDEAAYQNSLNARLQKIVEEGQALLERAGLPSDPRAAHEVDLRTGNWRVLSEQDYVEGNYRPGCTISGWGLRVPVSAWAEALSHPEDCEEVLSASALDHVFRIESFWESGDFDLAARFCIDLGALVSATQMKVEWEEHALRGEKSPKAGHKGNEQRFGDEGTKLRRWASMEARVNQMSSNDPKLQMKIIYQDVGREFGVRDETVRKSIQKLKKRRQ